MGVSKMSWRERTRGVDRTTPSRPIATVDEPTKREPAKKRRKVTGEEGREASVVAERREEGRRAELVPKTPETSE